MNKEKAIQRLKSLELCLTVHPHNEPNSEFEDRISDLEEIIEWLELWNGYTLPKQNLKP